MHNEDKIALTGSQAGMRFIAQMKLYNDGDNQRLLTFLSESYSETLLAEQDVHARLAALAAQRASIGRQKVKQVLATGKHQVSIVTTAEHAAQLYYVEVQVQDEYPHKITRFLHAPMEIITE